MTSDDRAELLLDAADIIGDRDAVPDLATLVSTYRAALEKEDAAPPWKRIKAVPVRARARAKAIRDIIADMVAMMPYAGMEVRRAEIAAAFACATWVDRTADELSARVRPRAREFTSGGRGKRFRTGPSAQWRLALACANLLAQRRPDCISGTPSTPLHEMAVLLHMAAGGDEGAGIARACAEVGRRWRDRRIELKVAARLPEGDSDRVAALAEVERLTRELERGE
jgi:hypothetical protein